MTAQQSRVPCVTGMANSRTCEFGPVQRYNLGLPHQEIAHTNTSAGRFLCVVRPRLGKQGEQRNRDEDPHQSSHRPAKAHQISKRCQSMIEQRYRLGQDGQAIVAICTEYWCLNSVKSIFGQEQNRIYLSSEASAGIQRARKPKHIGLGHMCHRGSAHHHCVALDGLYFSTCWNLHQYTRRLLRSSARAPHTLRR